MSVDPRLQAIGRPSAAPARLRGEVAPNGQSPDLYAAIHRTVFGDGTLPVKALADRVGLSYPRLTDLANPTQQKPIKVVEAIALMLATGRTDIADVIEAALGRVAFAFPSSSKAPSHLHQELARNVSAFGAFLQENSVALADGILEPHEARAVTIAVDEIVARLCEYRALIQQMPSGAIVAKAVNA